MADHRVPLLGDAWRRFDDPETSRDPRIRALVRDLSTVSMGPPPSAAFRADLRAQLVAITPRIVAESVAEGSAMVDIVPRPAPAKAEAATDRPRTRWSFARITGIATCVIVAFAILLGGAVLMSRNALPGDTLYGLKRASERFELATDSSDGARASDLLSFAQTRADEVRQLVTRSSSTDSSGTRTLDANTVSLVSSTLTSANSDVVDASKLLAQQAVQDGSAAPLATMTNWAPQQMKRLQSIDAIAAVRNDQAIHQQTSESVTLVSKVSTRADLLITSVGKACMLYAYSDSLGPVPCSASQQQPAATSSPPVKTLHPTSTRPSTPVRSGSPVNPGHSDPVKVQPQPSLGSGPSTPSPGSVLPTKPSLPITGVSLPVLPPPVSLSPGCASVSLGGLHLNIGTCSTPKP